ncbi:MAG: VWA domain-containing protein [Verrucomicrobiota bacterium]
MTFAHSHYLWLLPVLIPLLGLFYWWSDRERREQMARFIQARLLPGLTSGISPARRRVRVLLVITAVACLILALARPQWGYRLEEVSRRGLDIVVAIDTSKSMLARDIAPSRLARAKLAALDLMRLAKSDRLGLVAFAATAFLQCPLTIDDSAFRESVESLSVDTIPEGGTDMADAIRTAMTAFGDGENYRTLVLFTDGEDHDNGALEAAKQAAKAGLRIFTVGIGSPDGELLVLNSTDGQPNYVRDAEGNVVKSRLNEALLKQIAEATGEFYMRLGGADSMDLLYQRGLAPLPKSESNEHWIRQSQDRYYWPLGLALLCLAVEMILPERKRAGRRRGAAGAAAAAVLLLLGAGRVGGAEPSPGAAWRDYQAGRFGQAQQEYALLAAKAKDEAGDGRLVFNAGTAAYRATNYDAAIQYFSAALAARDLKLQQAAYYNLGNAQFQRGCTATNIDELQSQWETAIRSFQSAVSLNTNDVDAAHNLAFARHGVQQIVELREAARRAKESADLAARRSEYHRAHQIMEQLLQQNPLGKQFEDFTRKLKEIDDIATPAQP